MVCTCRDRSSQLLPAACVAATSLDVFCGGMIAAIFSKEWGGVIFHWGRVSKARSFTVSVVEQKKVAYSKYPIGINR